MFEILNAIWVIRYMMMMMMLYVNTSSQTKLGAIATTKNTKTETLITVSP